MESSHRRDRDRKRVFPVTAGNLRQSHLYIKKADFDFFPADAFGGPRRNGHAGIEIVLDGLGQTIETDIPSDAKTGKPRNFLRDRQAIKRFYRHHAIAAGASLALERLDERKYVLTVHTDQPAPRKPRAAEFFAGIGLVRLALERQGWEVVFANDIDEDKAKMYRDNWPQDDHLVVGDIHKLTADDIPDCDLFTASFPCNDLSIAGS